MSSSPELLATCPVSFYQEKSVENGETLLLARFQGFSASYNQWIPESEIEGLLYEHPLLPSVRKMGAMNQQEKAKAKTTQARKGKKARGKSRKDAVSNTADVIPWYHACPFRTKGDPSLIPFNYDERDMEEAERLGVLAGIDATLHKVGEHMTWLKTRSDGKAGFVQWSLHLFEWERYQGWLLAGERSSSRNTAQYVQATQKLKDLDDLYDKVPLPSQSTMHVIDHFGRRIQLYEMAIIPSLLPDLQGWTVQMLKHSAMLNDLRGQDRYILDDTNAEDDYILAKCTGLIVDCTDVLRSKTASAIGSAASYLSHHDDGVVGRMGLQELMYTGFQLATQVMKDFEQGWYTSLDLYPSVADRVPPTRPSPVLSADLRQAKQAQEHHRACYGGKDHLKPYSCTMRNEYSMNWPEVQENAIALVQNYTRDFKAGPLGLDLATALNTRLGIKDRSTDGTSIDGSFSPLLMYDNSLLVNILRTHTVYTTRKRHDQQVIACFYPGISKLAFYTSVLSDMGSLHGRPLVSALVMASAQLLAWSELYRKAGDRSCRWSLAWHANVHALDFVTGAGGAELVCALIEHHHLGTTSTSRDDSRRLQAILLGMECDKGSCTQRLMFGEEAGVDELGGLSTKARESRCLGEVEKDLLAALPGPKRKDLHPCPDCLHGKPWSLQLWGTTRLIARSCHYNCKGVEMPTTM